MPKIEPLLSGPTGYRHDVSYRGVFIHRRTVEQYVHHALSQHVTRGFGISLPLPTSFADAATQQAVERMRHAHAESPRWNFRTLAEAQQYARLLMHACGAPELPIILQETHWEAHQGRNLRQRIA